MGTYFLNVLFAVLVCFSHAKLSSLGFNSTSLSSHVKCIESERQALLNFKQSLIDRYGMLSTWRDDDNNRDCCKWQGIQCNNETGQVNMLDLRGNYTQYLRGAINITSLIHLQNIQHLDLSNNDFRGSHIPKLMGSFTKLRHLNLNFSGFGGTIPYELGNLSRLEHLDLSSNFQIEGKIPSQLGKLTSLRYLDLGYDNVKGEIPYQFRNLSKIQYLNLEGNYLSGAIPFHIGNLPILHTLRLEGNFDLNINDSKWLSSLSSLTTLALRSLPNLGSSYYWQQMISELIPNLRELSLVYCNLTHKSFLWPSASIRNSSSSLVTLDLSHNLLKSPAIFQWLFNFTTNLRSLYLYYNLIESSIPDRFGKIMNSLENLDLSYNKLQGKIPASLGNICKLHELDLSRNNLSGEISSFIQNSSWCNRRVFHALDLSYNHITGMLPPDLSTFTSLRTLYLSDNQLVGDIIESHISNLTKLEELDLSDNSLSLKFATTWVPPFQLRSLGLASCKLGPSFPTWLQTQNELWFLDISNAGIDDFVPDWFWNKLKSIDKMNMSFNSLKGTIPNLPFKLSSWTCIILNSNQFEGGIPAFLSQAKELDLSNNQISDLNTFLCGKGETTNLQTLDLSNNQIMGQLTNCWEQLNSLEFLDLSGNKLSGEIPQSMGTLVNLEVLVLRKNSLTGEVPLRFKNCTRLVILDVSENLLFGPIPTWIGDSMQQLKILSLRINRFLGSVPIHLCYLRQIHLLDLSRNNLSGEIPKCLRNLTAMMEAVVEGRERRLFRKMSLKVTLIDMYESNVLFMWKGQDYEFWDPENLLKSIDLSSNDLTGEIPKEVGYLLGLVSLNLSRNNLNGEIPFEIGNLNSLDFLDLSRNHFSGRIPSTLSKIDGLGKLDLSNNNLNGRIPWEGHLKTFDASSFEGNVGLCGQQLNKSCPGDVTAVQPQEPAVHGKDDNSGFYEALYMSLGIGFFAGFWGLLGPIILWQPWRIAYGRFLNEVTDYIFVMVEVNIAKCHRWLKG